MLSMTLSTVKLAQLRHPDGDGLASDGAYSNATACLAVVACAFTACSDQARFPSQFEGRAGMHPRHCSASCEDGRAAYGPMLLGKFKFADRQGKTVKSPFFPVFGCMFNPAGQRCKYQCLST